MRQAGPQFLSQVGSEVIRFAPFAILVFNVQDVVEIANAEALRILAAGSGQTEIVGQSLDSLFPDIDFSNVGQGELLRVRTKPKHVELELQCVRVEQDGCFRTIVYLCQFGGRRQREIILEKEACTDELSGLANRRAFQRTMESNQHKALSLAIVDIDQFKMVNDAHGHPAGDEVIQLVSRQLQESFSDNAILISRMGGDEFSILFETVDSELIVEALKDYCERIQRSELPQQPGVKVSVSIGIAISTRPSIGTRALLTRADQQLYMAKRRGRNQVAHVLLDE